MEQIQHYFFGGIWALFMSSKKIILMANGKHKKDILEKAMLGDITPEVPASFLQEHDNIGVYYSD